MIPDLKALPVLDSRKRSNLSSHRQATCIALWRRFIASKEFDRDGWELAQMSCSQQTDGNSCGVFTLMNAWSLASGAQLEDILQNNCPAYRKKILNELETFSL